MRRPPPRGRPYGHSLQLGGLRRNGLRGRDLRRRNGLQFLQLLQQLLSQVRLPPRPRLPRVLRPKKVTKHEYTCLCEDICIPGCSCCCNHCRNCGCDNGNNGCQEGCGCGCGGKCLVRDVSRLVIHPVVTEVPVKKCTVEWVCPHCGCSACEQCGSTPAGLCQPNAK